MMTSDFGNDSWNNGGRYKDNTRYVGRLNYVYNKVNSDALQKVASSLRDGVPCEVHPKFSAGEFNVVRLVEFEDGVRWVARLRMPRIEAFDAEGHVAKPELIAWTDHDAKAFISEIATMRFVRKQTSIPVPEIFGYNTQTDVSIGFPWIMMSYIDGMTAFDIAAKAGQPMRVPEQFFDHYFKQIAKIINELASARAPCIGSICKLPEGNTLTEGCMGPIAETQSGPWTSPADFYRHYPQSLMTSFYGSSPEAQIESGGKETIKLFTEMFGADGKVSAGEETDFGLVNLEIGTHNVIVDKDFNVLSVIDWDSTLAAPRAVCHQFPWCMGADPGIPGGVSEIFKPLDGQKEMMMAFCQALARESALLPSAHLDARPLFTIDDFFTKEALAFRAIAFFRVRQNWVDQEWKEALNWLSTKTQEDIWAWYGVRRIDQES